jgi:hypothetical protein
VAGDHAFRNALRDMMKSRLVDTITSNEDSVRLRIFDGDLPADEAMAELLRIERIQHEVTRRHMHGLRELLETECARHKVTRRRLRDALKVLRA